jgi:hypothetical protein
MNTDNAKLSAQPGDTFIAYIDDATHCVGVVIREDNDNRNWLTLVLGYFTEKPWGKDVFGSPFPYTFPGYLAIMKKNVVPYDFEREISLCKMRDSAWWKSLEPPCYTNLVAQHFRPRQLKELQHIDMARHILKGRAIDTIKSFGYWDEETFLRMWAVLYIHFSEQVVRPPKQRDAKNSNVFYTIDLESDPPKVTFGLRPIEYRKDEIILSIY